MNNRPYRYRTKRQLDIVLSALGLVIAAPLLLVVALFVRWRLGQPVLFRQQRAGWRGNAFLILKFRTMTDERDASGKLLPDSRRLNSFGRFLRRTSLDELPELWNVLCGDMSLVGPRPLFTKYLPLYDERQLHRHDVLPGITGWAQINGRNILSWEQKFELDLWYVDHQTLGLDLKILLLTPWLLVAGRGISQPGEATAAEFQGRLQTKARP